MENKIIINVIGQIRGVVEFDCYVFIGNYWDVWVFGVVDVVSGMVVMMELFCGLGEFFKMGW